MDSDTYSERGLYETREPNPAWLELLDFLAEQVVTIDDRLLCGGAADRHPHRPADRPPLSHTHRGCRPGPTSIDLTTRVWREPASPTLSTAK